MRARRQKRSTLLSEDAGVNPKKAVKNGQLNEKAIKMEAEEVSFIPESPSTSNNNVNVQQISTRPVRQRRVTKKLEESYIPTNLLKPSPCTEKPPPTKRPKRQIKPKPPSSPIKSQLDIKVESDASSEPELNEDFSLLAQQLLKTLNKSRNESEHFMLRQEIFDEPELKIKEEPLDEIISRENSSTSPTILPRSVKSPTNKRKKLHLKTSSTSKLKRPLLTARQRYRFLTGKDSIFDNQRLKPQQNDFIAKLPKPEMPQSIDKHIEKEQMRPMISSLIQSQEINFKRAKFQQSFRIVQSSVIKHAPGLFPVFIDIMKETQTNMQGYGYFERRESQSMGADRLLKMLTNLKDLRLNVKCDEKPIKQEPDYD